MIDGGGRDDATDRMLVTSVLEKRDERAFDMLYDRHTPRLLMFARRVCGGVDADAEDVVQDTWVRAFDRLGDFAWQSSLRTWLTGIAFNVGREVLRRRGARIGNRAPQSGNEGPEIHTRIDLERALELLPEELRLVVLLHDIEGYTHDEVAEMTGTAPGTSKSRLHRARAALRRSVGIASLNRDGTDDV